MLRVPFAMRVVHLNGSVTLEVSGELDRVTGPRLTTTVEDLVSVQLRSFAIDLGHLAFCDVGGLDALDRARRAARVVNVPFTLVGVSESMLRVMRLARFSSLLDQVDLALDQRAS